jgi:hypothetical protein
MKKLMGKEKEKWIEIDLVSLSDRCWYSGKADVAAGPDV